MTRKEAREIMMQVLFQMESNNDFNVDNRDVYLDQEKIKAQKNYCNDTFSLICNKKELIDETIDKYSLKWKSNRIPKTDLAVLRLAICEIMFEDDIPNSTSINEAVELAKVYGTDNSPKYVNGILGAFVKEGLE